MASVVGALVMFYVFKLNELMVVRVLFVSGVYGPYGIYVYTFAIVCATNSF